MNYSELLDVTIKTRGSMGVDYKLDDAGFECKITIKLDGQEPIDYLGTGETKKAAKNAACKLAMEDPRILYHQGTMLPESSNATLRLNNIAQRKSYNVVESYSTSGPPHMPQFNCKLTIRMRGLEYTFEGVGSNKKIAKNDAATRAVDYIDNGVRWTAPAFVPSSSASVQSTTASTVMATAMQPLPAFAAAISNAMNKIAAPTSAAKIAELEAKIVELEAKIAMRSDAMRGDAMRGDAMCGDAMDSPTGVKFCDMCGTNGFSFSFRKQFRDDLGQFEVSVTLAKDGEIYPCRAGYNVREPSAHEIALQEGINMLAKVTIHTPNYYRLLKACGGEFVISIKHSKTTPILFRGELEIIHVDSGATQVIAQEDVNLYQLNQVLYGIGCTYVAEYDEHDHDERGEHDNSWD